MNSVETSRIEKFEATLSPAVKANVFADLGEDCKWGRILLTWNERTADGIKKNQYAARINRENGDIYLDCRPQKIAAKCFFSTLGHPVFTLSKTVRDYVDHYKEMKTTLNAKDSSRCDKALAVPKFIAKVLLVTPLRNAVLGTCLTILAAVGFLLGLCAAATGIRKLETLLLDLREFTGKVENYMERGQKSDTTTVAPCFQPMIELRDIQKDPTAVYNTLNGRKCEPVERNIVDGKRVWVKRNWDDSDIVEQFGTDPTMRSLNVWLKDHLNFRRNCRWCFNDYCNLTLDKAAAHVSAAFNDMCSAGVVRQKKLNDLLIDPITRRNLDAKINNWMRT